MASQHVIKFRKVVLLFKLVPILIKNGSQAAFFMCLGAGIPEN